MSGVVGLDLSLAGPAGCYLPALWEPGDWSRVVVANWVVPLAALPEEPDQTDRERARIHRLDVISEMVCHFVQSHQPEVVAVEDYAFSRSSAAVTKLAELGGVVRVELLRVGYVALPVTASSARKFLLGKVPRKGAKVAAQSAVYRAGAPRWTGDEVDAFVVANGARAELGLLGLTLA